MKNKLFYCTAILLLFLNACSKDEKGEIDNESPLIEISSKNHFPQQCADVKRGETFTFHAKFTDNKELGTYTLDIHHNFDNHNHSTEVESCHLDPVKQPVKPFLFIKSYDIPKGLTNYTAKQQINIPYDIDPGDYHFTIRLTDQEGWSEVKGLSIKITE